MQVDDSDVRLVHTFQHSVRFGSLHPVHLVITLALIGPYGAYGGEALFIASGSDDDFEYDLRARVTLPAFTENIASIARASGTDVLQGPRKKGPRKMNVVCARLERSWMMIEELDALSFHPVLEAVSGELNCDLVETADTADTHEWSPDECPTHSHASLEQALIRRQAVLVIQRAFRMFAERRRTWKRGASALEKHLESIKQRLWCPSGRLMQTRFESV